MSAFIVDNSTMHAVVAAMLGRDSSDHDRATDLGRKLFAMNAEAVAARYNEAPSTEEAAAYVFNRAAGLQANAIGRSKALACFLYQCSEGDVPESDLFREAAACHARVNADIVSALPAWSASPAWR